jgi:meiotic recombination protein REC8, fungi type
VSNHKCWTKTRLTRGSPREQLIIEDDPAFNIDFPLPALDFNFSQLELDPHGDSQRSSQSLMSVRGRSGSVSSHAASVLGLNIPSSSGRGSGAYQLPLLDPFGDSSAQRPFGGVGIFNNEEDLVLADDDLFDFDANGEIREIPESERAARRAGSLHPQGRLGSDSAASGRVRKEHEDALAGRPLPIIDGEGDFNMDYNMFQYGDDDMQMLPDAEPFGLPSGSKDKLAQPESEARVSSEEPSSVSAEAPQKRRKAKAKKKLALDNDLEIMSGVLITWQRDYLHNMKAQKLIGIHKKATAVAKKNAFHFVFGSGIMGVGEGVGSAKFTSPLAMFSGEALLAQLTGKAAPSTVKDKANKGTKRSHPEDDEEGSSVKRARESEQGRGNYEDEGFMPNMEDEPYPPHNDHEQSVELGREAPSALQDHPSSAMPWNQSASANSFQRGLSSSARARGVGSIGTGRRLTSASPLIGRGSALPGDLEHFSQLMGEDEDMVMYGRDDFGSASQASGYGGGARPSSSQAEKEFELFGAAAGVDTQTAGTSQWVREALDKESNNFFEFVRNTISEKAGDELGNDEDELAGGMVGAGEGNYVTFEELFVPEQNSRIVAAQAFYHVLSLATKGRVWVEQSVGFDLEPFGEIRVGVV